jgi:hypothetical protein
VLTLQSTSKINLTSNVFWVGSDTVNPLYQRKSNINMYNSTGDVWETQSSAFTEDLKQSVLSSALRLNVSSFGGNKGKIILTRRFQIMGQTSILNGATYNNTTNYNVGAQLNASYPTLFDVNGKFVGSQSMNFTISFQLGFLCKNSSITIFKI